MTSTKRILVIDDDADIGDVVATFLEEEGYAVTVVTSITSGLETAQSARPDLILLDLSVGGRSGTGFVEAYRALPSSTAPVILMSGHAQLARVAAQLHADGFLEKPFDLLVLLDTVEQAVARPVAGHVVPATVVPQPCTPQPYPPMPPTGGP